MGSGVEQKASNTHGDEADDHAFFVANVGDELSAGNGEYEVGGKEGELHETRLEVGEFEDITEAGDEAVDEYGDEPPHEEEGGYDGEGNSKVGGFLVGHGGDGAG